MGVLKNSEPETFVIVTLDPQSGQFFKHISFATEKEFRERFKSMAQGELDALIANIRNHPVD
jgi:hypothetical protein